MLGRMSAPSSDPDVRVKGLQSAFRGPLAFPHLMLRLVLAFLACGGAATLGRVGTDQARLSAAVLLGLFFLLMIVFLRHRSRRWKKPKLALEHTLRRVEPERAGQAVRAYSLLKRVEGQDSGQAESKELARQHWRDVLDGISLEQVSQVGRNLRRRSMWLVLAGALLCLWLLTFRFLFLIEGVNVMLARNGQAPLALAYVSQVSVTAEWPSYLDGTGKKRVFGSQLMAVPEGAEIEVRVLPRVQSRELFLTDGVREEPLLSDGRGGLLARWRAEEPSALRVAARFGDVLIFDTHETKLSPLDDKAPQVTLIGAPQELLLEDLESLPLKFFAVDDHGLTQIDLVLQSGQRSSRKELAHLDGQEQIYQGGTTLTREHELLRKAFLPVRVTIEARDGNTASGPSWGRSKAIVLLPEPLGADLAKRHVALRAFRRQLSVFLAEDIRASHQSRHIAEETLESAHVTLLDAFSQLEADLLESNPPRSSIAFVKAQLEALSKKGEEKTEPEAALLAVDALIAHLAGRDAQDLAKNLGAAVEEIAVQARELRFQSEEVSLEGVKDLLRGAQDGAGQLREVGRLGLDLGSVAKADLGRIERSIAAGSYGRAEAAAVHLAERLKRANASFSSKGGAGVESGTPSGGQSGSGQGAPGPASDAPEQFQELSEQVDNLAQEHAEELSQLERLLEEAAQAAREDFEPDEELRDATEELRDALAQLPQNGMTPGSPRAEAASARSQGEAMADALESGDLAEALERGADAGEAMRRAQRLARENPGWVMPRDLDRASQALQGLMEETKKAAEKQSRQSPSGSSSGLAERAERQREFADRAGKLAEQARQPGAPLPSESADSLEQAAKLLKDAAQALQTGRSQEGADLADQAQAALERAMPSPSDSPSQSEGTGEGEGDSARSGRVPDEEKDRARDYRRRVEKGLGRGSGRLAPAVRRYAEELK